MNIGHFILKDKKPLETDLISWALWMNDVSQRIVAKDKFGDVEVSTVFLGLDHNWGGGEPLLFETMIFGGEYADYQKRCSTWEQAEKMHKDAIDLINK